MTLRRPGSKDFRIPALLAALLLAGPLPGCSDDGPLQWPDNGPRTDLAGDGGHDLSTDPGRDPGRDAAPDGTPFDTGGDDGDRDPGMVDDARKDDSEAPQCPAAGAVLITELMPNPEKAGEPEGEYLEVHNPGAAAVDLAGWELRSGDTTVTVDKSVVVPAGGWVVLARSADGGANGGLSPAWVYGKVTLANSGEDDATLACGGTVVDRVAYGSGWPLQAGKALVLDPSGLDGTRNDDPRWWCAAAAPFGAGDLGSPGQANVACGASSCGDEVVQAWETCDDGNPAGGPCPADCGTTTASDRDHDGVEDAEDNCPDTPNGLQVDTDKDGIGDACDFGSCGDGNPEGTEQCDDGNTDPGDGCTPGCRDESFAEGSVIIAEFMYNPKAVGDTAGEWVELHNPGAGAIDVAGWVLADAAGDAVRLLPASKTLPIPAGGTIVVGHSDEVSSNGGVAVDFAYGAKPVLNNDKDTLTLSWNGNVIDEVAYDTGEGWPVADGASVQLDADLLDWELNDLAEAWCVTPVSETLPGGDHGTPGAPNVPCGL